MTGAYTGDTEVFKLSFLQFPNKAGVRCSLDTKTVWMYDDSEAKSYLCYTYENIYKIFVQVLNQSLIRSLLTGRRGDASSENYMKNTNILLYI